MKNHQEPFKTNQIINERPNVPKTAIPLTGFIATSFNGGHNRTIAWKKCMAGEKHYQYNVKLKIKTLTPLTPVYQPLKCTIRAYYVPNSRVWTNAEKYTAQKGGTSETKITNIPFINTPIPYIELQENIEDGVLITQTDLWRDSFLSAYLPRVGLNQIYNGPNQEQKNRYLPQASILPIRGRVAIYNDFERNKEYDVEQTEYKTDTVSNTEMNKYFPTDIGKRDFHNMRAKRPNSYYTDYRTEYQGFSESAPSTSAQGNQNFINWADWESKISFARTQALNSQKNDWDIISQIRGSKKLTEGKVQLIGEKTFNLNYAAITQSTYNQNENIREEFQVMGTQGAYSYTEIETPIYAGFKTVEEGYLHVIATVWAQTIFESGIDRNLLNIKPLDEYNPDLIDQKFDTLYRGENGTNAISIETRDNYTIPLGYKRKFNEIFRLPNCISGDLTTPNYRKTEMGVINGEIITQNTYQFFETDRFTELNKTGGIEEYNKKVWKDYTDIMLNKNQAIENEIEYYAGDNETDIETTSVTIKGQNQIDLVGYATLYAELPVDESIVNNYTEWGEH